MKLLSISILILILTPLRLNADIFAKTRFSLGTDIIYINHANSDIKYSNPVKADNLLNRFSGLSVGVSHAPFEIPVIITLKTNRLFSNTQNSKAFDTKRNRAVDVDLRIKNDSISVAYYYKKFMPFVAYTWTSIDSTYRYGTISIKKEIDTNFKLVGLGFMVTRSIQLGQYYVFKNKASNVDYIFGTSINYIF